MPTRRQFLTLSGPGARNGGHVVVCVFMRGGADTLNMLVPFGDDDYYRARPSLAIAPPGSSESAAIALDDRFGFHPKMRPLVPAFREGHLAVVNAVGSDNT